MRATTVRAASLTTHLVDIGVPEGAEPAALIVLCHGFGAPGTDLVPIAAEMASLRSELTGVRFAFPEGPLDLADIGFWGARAWFHIDLERLTTGSVEERMRELQAGHPPGMEEARRALARAVESLLVHAKLPWSRLVLGGFSQGAMMAIELAMTSEEAPAGLIAWSPTLVNREALQRRAPNRAGLNTLISHGRQDAILPFGATLSLVEVLRTAGLGVRFRPFDGPHTISADALEHAVSLVLETALTSNDR